MTLGIGISYEWFGFGVERSNVRLTAIWHGFELYKARFPLPELTARVDG